MSFCLITAARVLTPDLEGVRAPGSARESPYASAKDDQASSTASAVGRSATAAEALSCHPTAGTRKESPYVSAKDEAAVVVEPTLGHLWRLLVPVLLAGGSYGWLRSRERSDIT